MLKTKYHFIPIHTKYVTNSSSILALKCFSQFKSVNQFNNNYNLILEKYQLLRNENVVSKPKTIEILQFQHLVFINFELSLVP